MNGQPPEEHPFAHYDAAYVLGALSPEDRAAFAVHLRTCQACARSVAELASLPALLGRVPAAAAVLLDENGFRGVDDGTRVAPSPSPERVAPSASEGSDGGPPGTLLEGLLTHVRHEERRRRRVRAAIAAGAAALVAAVAAVVLVFGPWNEAGRVDSPSSAETVELAAVAPSPMSVTARLTSKAWGTGIELECTYEGDSSGSSRYDSGSTYALVVRDENGSAQQVATWRAVPGRVVTVQAATALPRGLISELEIRDAAGTPLLRAQG